MTSRTTHGGPARPIERAAIAVLVVLVVVLAAQMYRSAYREHGNDLTSYLLSAQALARGDSPYAPKTPFPYIYPITLAFLLIPLAVLPYAAAALIWFGANAAALVAACVSMLRAARIELRTAIVPLTIAAVLLLDVVQNNLRNGQVNFLVLAMCVRGLRASMGRRAAASGVWLGLAASIKLLPVILFGYLLMRRQFRAIAWGLATIALLAIAPYPLLGDRLVPIVEEYVRTFVLRSFDPAAAIPDLLDFRLARVFDLLLPLPAALGAIWAQRLAALAVIGVLIAIDRGRPAPRPVSPREAWLGSLYLLAMPLLSPVSEVHHLAFALPAAGLQAVRLATTPRPFTALPVLVGCLAIALAGYFAGQLLASGLGYLLALTLLAAVTVPMAFERRA